MLIHHWLKTRKELEFPHASFIGSGSVFLVRNFGKFSLRGHFGDFEVQDLPGKGNSQCDRKRLTLGVFKGFHVIEDEFFHFRKGLIGFLEFIQALKTEKNKFSNDGGSADVQKPPDSPLGNSRDEFAANAKVEMAFILVSAGVKSSRGEASFAVEAAESLHVFAVRFSSKPACADARRPPFGLVFSFGAVGAGVLHNKYEKAKFLP
jgi:hypothetical protein